MAYITGTTQEERQYGSKKKVAFTATSGQTVFSPGFDYIPGSNVLEVYINGVKQSGSAYVESQNFITLTEGVEAGDIVEIVSDVVEHRLTGEVEWLRRNYGPYPSDPTLRPDGTARVAGDEYFNTTLGKKRYFNGAVWVFDITQTNLIRNTVMGFDATGYADGEMIYFKGRDVVGDGGGGMFRYSALSTQTVDNVLVFSPSSGGGRLFRDGWTAMGFNGDINVRWAGAKGDGNQTTGVGTDDTVAINRAIAALGGEHDITTAYIYKPTRKLKIPSGVYIISGQILADRNNIIIDGDGMFNTVLLCSRSVQITNMVRFQGAYACQLNHLTIDGGLPFTPTASESYGSDVGLTLDQVAHFSSIGLNIVNTRYEGKRCIHVWESYFEDLRIFNTGFFGNATNRSAGIRFTQVGKLDNTFPGGESNNIVYNKVSFGTVGSYVSADEVPTYNTFFNNVIAEGRTWSTNYASLGETKWRVGGTASNFVINTGYSFPHAQPFVCNATLFDFSNVGPGCRVRDYRVYQSLDSTYQEVTRILSCDSNHLLEFDVSVEEVGSNSTTLINSSTISNVSGVWEYRSNLSRARSTLFYGTSESRFTGRLLLRNSTSTTPYQYRGNAVLHGVIDGDTTVRPQYAAYAFANVDGRSTGGPRTLRGLTYSRLTTGQYQFTFTQAMPDSAYAVIVSSDVLNNASERPEVGAQTNTGFTIANRAGASYFDPSNLNVVVFR